MFLFFLGRWGHSLGCSYFFMFTSYSTFRNKVKPTLFCIEYIFTVKYDILLVYVRKDWKIVILASQLYFFVKMFLFFLGRWAHRLGCSYFYIFFEFWTSIPYMFLFWNVLIKKCVSFVKTNQKSDWKYVEYQNIAQCLAGGLSYSKITFPLRYFALI